MTPTPSPLLELDPKQLSGFIGRTGSLGARIFKLNDLNGRPVAGVGVALAAAAVIVVSLDRGLLLTEGKQQTVWRRLFIESGHTDLPPTLGLLLDPAGLLLLFAAVFAPICFTVQCREISRFVGMCELNSRYLGLARRDGEINAATRAANVWFRRIGSRWATAALSLMALGLSVCMFLLIDHQGLMASWRQSGAPKATWSHIVYEQWWANPSSAPYGCGVLLIATWWMFFILNKQLLMGLVFMHYSRRYLHLEFGVTPDLRYNPDGYWGLLHLRRFMTWTYVSSLVHITAFFAVVSIWLTFTQWTVIGFVVVLCLNVAVVIYPSTVADRGAAESKKRYIEHRIQNSTSALDNTEWIDKIWRIPDLPFRTRNRGSALLIYLLFPAIVGVVGSMVK